MLKENELTERANEVMNEASKRVEEASLDSLTSVIEHGEPSKVIRDSIAENGIALAVGAHGQTDFSQYAMGGVSSKHVRTSPVPVIWVREPDSDGSSDS